MSVTAAQGFVAAGIAAGIKPSGAPDLALVATDDAQPVTTAAVFTQNKMTAAPVLVSKDHLAASAGKAAAVILNSGCANAATGAEGRTDAETMTACVAKALGTDPDAVLVCSTGLIGYRLPMDRIEAGIPTLVEARSADGGPDAATAIMTTDTHAKQSVARVGAAVVGGMAKGAAMLRPDMATMLAVLTTDAEVSRDELQAALASAVDVSFNRLTTDGSQSTNDTVICMASGQAGPVDLGELRNALTEVCTDLAHQMAADAEGSTKVVRVRVIGAASDDEAQRGARQVGQSELVKCSWYGQDPYWGRVASELGAAGIEFDQTRVSVRYGDHVVARDGVECDHDADALREYMAEKFLEVTADLGLGDGEGWVVSVDLTHAYIDENMGTS